MKAPPVRLRLSLQQRILLPFFLVLILVGILITCGTSFDIASSYTKNVDERLQAFHEVLYREVKKQEQLLVSYANLLAYMQATEHTADASILQDQIYNSLHETKIAVATYSTAAREIIPYPSLRALLDQALQSGRPRFRLATDLGSTPSLTVAARASFDPARQGVIVLQTPFDRNLLTGMAAGFKVTPHLLSLERTLLVAGMDDAVLPTIAQTEMATLFAGKPLFKTVNGRRYLFQAIPLGTTDLLIAAAEAPMYDLGDALQSLTLRSVAIILLALVAGSFLYYRLLRQITRPVEEIRRAVHAISKGNLSFRLGHLADNEIGRIGVAFNAMLEQIEIIHAEDLSRQENTMLAQAEARHQKLLQRKNLEISMAAQELRTSQGEASLLLQLIQATNTIQDVNLYLERVLELAQKAVHCQTLAILMHHPGTENLEVRKIAGPEPDRLSELKFRVDNGFTGRVVKLMEMVYLNDLQADNPRFDYPGGTLPGGSLVCAPLIMNRRLAGMILLHKKAAHGFREGELKLIQAIGWELAIGLETAHLHEWTHSLATTDDLTGLSNRRFFQEILKRELAQAQRYGSPFSLLMLDLDHFCLYNEAQGSLCDDSALQQVASILLQNTRGIDLVARFGNDQFVILLPKTDKNGAFKAAEKLRLCIAAHEFPGGKNLPEVRLTASVGISGYPTDSRDAYEIIDCADRALCQAKEAGRNCCHFWQAPGADEFAKDVHAIF